MSIKALNYALDIKVGDPTAKLIFINLANHFNDATQYSFPSQELLAERAECSIRTVQRKIEMLIELGLIKKKFRPNKSSLYDFPGLNGYDNLDVSDCHIQKMVTTKSGLVTTDGVVRTINNNHYNNNNKKKSKEVLLIDFEVTYDIKKYATDLGLDADDIIEDIRLWNEQNGNKAKYANPNAFYMNWFRKEAKRKPKTFVKVQSDQKDKSTSVRAEKELSQPQKDLIQSWLDQLYRKAQSNPSEWGGVNYDKLRNAFTTSMKFQYAEYYGEKLTTRELCDKFELGR